MKKMRPKTYRVKTASEVYNVPAQLLRYWCLIGKIKAKKAGRFWYIPVEELDRHFIGGRNHGREEEPVTGD